MYKIVQRETKADLSDIWFSVSDYCQKPDQLPAPFTDFDTPLVQANMEDQDPTYGGTVIILVTKDTDGNYQVADFYGAKADYSVKTERP